MITAEDIYRIMGISEAYQLPEALMAKLLDAEKRTAMFEVFLAVESDLSRDWFTDYFQAEQSNRKGMMQDYTPDCVCKLVSGLIGEADVIQDVCAGIGGLSISAWNKNPGAFFVGEELSNNSMALLLFNMAIRGMRGVVYNKDVLTNEVRATYRLTPDGRFSDIEVVMDEVPQKARAVISNPPYSLKWDAVDQYKNDSRFSYGLPPKKAADFAFVQHGLDQLEEGGRMVAILPTGVLFRGGREMEIRKNLIESGALEAVIALPNKLFFNTQIPVVLLCFEKGRKAGDVLIVDASKGFTKRGKQNDMSEEHLAHILEVYQARKEERKFSHIAKLDEIRKHDYSLNVPTYVDTFERPKLPSSKEIVKSLEESYERGLAISKEVQLAIADIRGSREWEENKQALIALLDKHARLNLAGLNKMFDEVEKTYAKELQNKKRQNVLEVASFERAKKGKVYPAGAIALQLSASSGQLYRLKKDETVEDKYGVFIPNEGVAESAFLLVALETQMPEFRHKYQTGLNISPEMLKYLDVTLYESKELQHAISMCFDLQLQIIDMEREVLEEIEKINKIVFEAMFGDPAEVL